MTMKLTTQEKGNVIIVHTSGKLTLGDGSSALREKMRKLIKAGFRRILLDMPTLPILTAPATVNW
jgi:hypothetical protein